MIITRRGKCSADNCENRVTERREFIQNVDLFDQSPEVKIKGKLADELRKYKRQKLYCPEHHPDPSSIEVVHQILA